MTDLDDEITALIWDLTDLDPWAFAGGRSCAFCGTYNRDLHHPGCLWKRATALRWCRQPMLRGPR